MRFFYEAFDPARHGRAELERNLRRLFHDLLVRTDGDVEEALRWLELLAQRNDIFPPGYTIEDFRKLLEKAGEVRADAGGTAELTATGAREIRRDALEWIFEGLAKGGSGDHRIPKSGAGGERLSETRAYEFGDEVDAIDWSSTYRNAVSRERDVAADSPQDADPEDAAAARPIVRPREGDFEVFETEHKTSCATVLLLDVSHSMTLYGEDRMTPAKQVALALQELIETQFSKDTLDVVLFGDEAIRVTKDRLPFVSNGPFHTNTRAGLRLARELLLRTKATNKQIFMITDGKPSAITEDDGTIYKNPMGLDRRIVNKTLDEAAECKRKGILLSTFMVASDPYLVSFIEELSKAGRGKAYFSSLESLGSFVFVDFLRNRRRRAR
jgi:uncharacterized protein with von Willebrand factor type A (vWA) domain